MTTNKSHLLLLGVIVTISLISVPTLQEAFAHARTSLEVNSPVQRTISVVVGHTNEPTYGAEKGEHDGKHNMEVQISDAATGLPLKDAKLKAHMFYFKDLETFKKSKLKEATTKTNVNVAAVFGDPGHYMIREVQTSGIYGYRIFGTVDYFGVASVPIDTRIFCSSSQGSTTKFNSPGWSGSFGCTEHLKTIKFP